jgi:hypothetical protein
MAKFAVIDE